MAKTEETFREGEKKKKKPLCEGFSSHCLFKRWMARVPFASEQASMAEGLEPKRGEKRIMCDCQYIMLKKDR